VRSDRSPALEGIIMPETRPGVIDAASDVVVLAFDLFDATLPETPLLLARALQSAPVQDAVKKTLLDFANAKVKKGIVNGTSAEEGRKLLKAMREGVVNGAQKDLLAQIKKTPEYRALEKGVTTFRKAAASSSLGVWVDRNKGVLYVVGAVLAAGTAGVLYYTKSNHLVVKSAVDLLKDREFEVLKIGTLTFKAAAWDFKPDARVLGAKTLVTKQWQQVSLDLKLGLLAQGASIQQVEGTAILKSGGFSLNLTGNGKPEEKQVNLALKLDYSGVIDSGTFNVGIGAMYQEGKGSGTLNASYKTGGTKVGLEGQIGAKDGGGMQYGGLLTLSVDL
jgi:hypothetical protein